MIALGTLGDDFIKSSKSCFGLFIRKNIFECILFNLI